MAALMIQSQDQFDEELAKATDKPVVVAFTSMTAANFATMYAAAVTEYSQKSNAVFLLVIVDCGPAGKEIADKVGVADTPTFLFYFNGEKVTSFTNPEAQTLLEFLQKKLEEMQ